MSPLTDLYDNAALRKLTTKILHTDILYKYLPSIQSKTSTLAFPRLQTHRPGHGLLEPEWLCASKYCNVPVSGNILTSQPGNRAGKRWTHDQQIQHLSSISIPTLDHNILLPSSFYA